MSLSNITKYVTHRHSRSLFLHGIGSIVQSNEADNSSGTGKPLVSGQPLLFGTVNGLVGAVLTLTEDNYSVLSQLQTAMTKVVMGVGSFSHEEWRSFTNGRRSSPSSNFIDGDLIESYLDMPREKQEETMTHLTLELQDSSDLWTVEDVVHRVEEMQRLH